MIIDVPHAGEVVRELGARDVLVDHRPGAGIRIGPHFFNTDEEVERLGAQLNAILEAVGKVAELDLEGVEPTAHPLELVNVWAEDEPRSSLPVEEALANAPEREQDFFKVPPA